MRQLRVVPALSGTRASNQRGLQMKPFVIMTAALAGVMITIQAGAAPTRSTTIALTSNEQFVVVVNREANSFSIIKIKNANGNDVSKKIAEIPVGEEPRCVAIHP